jgi:hypothetical protein
MVDRKVVPFDEFYYQLKLMYVLISATRCKTVLGRSVHTSSRQHNILYLGLDIGLLILHTNSRQGKNAPQILDSNSRQKKILVIESTVTKVRFNDESSMF